MSRFDQRPRAKFGCVVLRLSVLAFIAITIPMPAAADGPIHSCTCNQISLCKVKSGANVLPALPGQEFTGLTRRNNGKFAVVVNGKVTKTLVGTGWVCDGSERNAAGETKMEEHMRGQREAVERQQRKNSKALAERSERIQAQEAERRRIAGEREAAAAAEAAAEAERRAAEEKELALERRRLDNAVEERFERIDSRILGTEELEAIVNEERSASVGRCAEACLERSSCRSFSYSAETTRVTGAPATHCLLYSRRTFGAGSLIPRPTYTHYDRAPEVSPSASSDQHLYDAVQGLYTKMKGPASDDCGQAREILYTFPVYWEERGRVPADRRYTVRFPREIANPTIAELARDRYIRFRHQVSSCLH